MQSLKGKENEKRKSVLDFVGFILGILFLVWLSGYILPFRRIGRLMKQNSIIFNRGIITVSWH